MLEVGVVGSVSADFSGFLAIFKHSVCHSMFGISENH
jgi:hypothetical protein